MVHRYLVLALTVALMACGRGDSSGQEPDSSEDELGQELEQDLLGMTMLRDRSEEDPAEISRGLELKPAKDFADFMDLGTAYLWEGRYIRAAEAYEGACLSAAEPESLACALYAKAAALGYGGRLDLAIRAADQLASVHPENAECAWLRAALCSKAGDEMGLSLARDHVIRLDPNAGGHPVMEPVTAVVILGAAVVLGATTVGLVALVPPEDRAEVAVQMHNGLVRIASGTLAAMLGGSPILLNDTPVPDLGRALLQVE